MESFHAGLKQLFSPTTNLNQTISSSTVTARFRVARISDQEQVGFMSPEIEWAPVDNGGMGARRVESGWEEQKGFCCTLFPRDLVHRSTPTAR